MRVHLLGSCAPCRPGGDLQAEQSQSQGGPDPGRLARAVQPHSGLRHGLRVLMRSVGTARHLCSSRVSRQTALRTMSTQPCPRRHSELHVQLQLQVLVLPGAHADLGWAAQVVLDDGGTVQPLHEGHEIVQLLQAAVLLLKQLQDGRSRAALAGQEPGHRRGEEGRGGRDAR